MLECNSPGQLEKWLPMQATHMAGHDGSGRREFYHCILLNVINYSYYYYSYQLQTLLTNDAPVQCSGMLWL